MRQALDRIVLRIWLPFTLVLLVCIVSIGVYYPRKQGELYREATNTRLREMASAVALSVELSLEHDEFEGVQRAVELASSTEDFAYVALVQREGSGAVFCERAAGTGEGIGKSEVVAVCVDVEDLAVGGRETRREIGGDAGAVLKGATTKGNRAAGSKGSGTVEAKSAGGERGASGIGVRAFQDQSAAAALNDNAGAGDAVGEIDALSDGVRAVE